MQNVLIWVNRLALALLILILGAGVVTVAKAEPNQFYGCVYEHKLNYIIKGLDGFCKGRV